MQQEPTDASATETKAMKEPATKKIGGGTAIGGGVNFQAIVTAIVGVHILRGIPLGWLDGLDGGTPVAVWAESEGPGDDLRLELTNGKVAEVQAKKGLQRGENLWDTLESISRGLHGGSIDFGILAVAPDSSSTVRESLSRDVERMGQGRTDQLTDIGADFLGRLSKVGIPSQPVCSRFRIRVVNGLTHDGVHIEAAKEVLRHVCADEADADAAWNALYRDAVLLIEMRGRRDLAGLVGVLVSKNIQIRDAEFPAGLSRKLATWILATTTDFRIAGLRKPLGLEHLLPMQTLLVPYQRPEAETALAALDRYHDSGDARRHSTGFDGQWAARFKPHAVVVAGPGLGKSTLLARLAREYALDGFPVLRVALKPVASAMREGRPFDATVKMLGLSGSGVRAEAIDRAGIRDWVILLDGLDDCGLEHEAVAQAIRAFAVGNPRARIVVTTRPIGYSTTELSTWPHYELLAPTSDSGSTNLGALIVAAGDNEPFKSDGYAIAKRELARTPAAATIATSPQMLGMAAATILRYKALPATRPQLYGLLVKLFEDQASSKASAPSLPGAIAARVLDTMGWLVLSDPILEAAKVISQCSAHLASDLGMTSLAAHSTIEATVRFWEGVGLLERVHHDGTSLFTFIHKSFAEFAASRFLIAMPDSERHAQLGRLVDLPEWSEVVSFAGGLGLGDEIAAFFFERRTSGDEAQLERALALIGDADADVSTELSKALVEFTFEECTRAHEEALKLGVALADLASSRPALVGPVAARYLDHTNPTMRLIAWASVVEAGAIHYPTDRLVPVMQDLLPTIRRNSGFGLLGGIRLGGYEDRKLIERIAIAALTVQSDEKLLAFAENDLADPVFGTWGFHSKVGALLTSRGFSKEFKPRWMQQQSLSGRDFMKPPGDWHVAARAATQALAEAVSNPNTDAAETAPRHLLNFAGLLEIAKFGDSAASDVHFWKEPYDQEAVRVAVGLLVSISVLDANALSTEADYVLQRMSADPDLSAFGFHLPAVDVPEPDWQRAAGSIDQRDALARAMLHPSEWMGYIATNLLSVMPASIEQSTSLLKAATGSTLRGAAFLVAQHHPGEAADLILDRLESEMPAGAGALFEALREIGVTTPRVLPVVERGLFARSGTAATAAAELARDLIGRGILSDASPIHSALAHWQATEPPTPESGAIPDSPRSLLLEMLIGMGRLEADALLNLVSDHRSDVRKVAQRHLLSLLPNDAIIADEVAKRILSQEINPSTASSILAADVIFSEPHELQLIALLESDDPKWRRAAMELMRPPHLSRSEIEAHAARLRDDPEDEIRRRAARCLNDLDS